MQCFKYFERYINDFFVYNFCGHLELCVKKLEAVMNGYLHDTWILVSRYYRHDFSIHRVWVIARKWLNKRKQKSMILAALEQIFQYIK